MGEGYALGDSPVAAERLRIVAEVFEPTTRALLADLPARPRRRLIDLGCGPGHSTRLLAAHFPAAQVVGVDRSSAFVTAARAAAIPAADFHVGDITTGTLPGAPADLLYARFVLSHLTKAARRITAWCGALSAGGVLVLEEPERIVTADEDFARYLELCAGMIAHRGGDLYCGPALAAGPPPSGTRRAIDRVVALDVPAGRAAAMFWRNLRACSDDEFVRATYTRAEVDALSRRLEARTGDEGRGVIDWALRQVVIESDPRLRLGSDSGASV